MKIDTLAAPVLLGIILKEAALPPLQSLLDGPSTVFWVADSSQKEDSNEHHRHLTLNKNMDLFKQRLLSDLWWREQWSWDPQQFRIGHWWPIQDQNYELKNTHATLKCREKHQEIYHYKGIKQKTLARGARQLVVQLALETMSSSGLYSFSLTPTTNMGASLLGAEITTFLAPPWEQPNPKSHSFLVFRIK